MIAADEKRVQIFNAIIYAAESISLIYKDYPVTGKKKRNVFIKKYNRRPMNKRKRNLIFAKAAMQQAISAMQISKIIQQPILKQ